MYDTCTHREIQTATAWGDEQITILYSPGALVGDKYVFVVDSANTPSTGALITFSNPTCEDGIQNGDESGVDCGGSCPACSAPGTLWNKAFTFGTAPQYFIEE